MNPEKIEISYYRHNSDKHLIFEDKKLIFNALEASKKSYAPYSKFNVGVAIELENSEIITASNQENAAYPSGLCAERVGVFYANANFPNQKIKKIVIAASKDGKQIKKAVSPCGACRQVLLESEIRQKSPIKMIFAGSEQVLVFNDAKSLLPVSFDSSFL